MPLADPNAYARYISRQRQIKSEREASMSLIRVERFLDDGRRTFGRMYVGGHFFCHTCEDTYRAKKIKHETRIWAGRYKLIDRRHGGFYNRYIARWPWHEGMIEIANVPEFSAILIHPGNTEKDTSGCILTGVWNKPNTWIAESAKTYERLYKAVYPRVKHGGQYIDIVDLDR